MQQISKYPLFLFLIILCFVCIQQGNAQSYSSQSVPFNQIHISDGFWSPRLEAHASQTLHVCIAQMEDSTKRISNFEKAAGLKDGKHEGIYFDDSDVYKAMEGIAYSLINNPNKEYEALLDRWISLIAKAQRSDGYLNTYFTLEGIDKRWTDMPRHEMYCGGHMIEAAIAHYQATGKKTFLNIAIKFADHLDDVFGPGKKHWVAGHEEIELALVKLYHSTGDKKYLDLSHWLLEERGHGYGKGRTWDRLGPSYCQDDVPVSDITDIKGHAVRAMYLFTGMADVAAEENVQAYVDALKRVWEDVVYRNMYLTGGIGSSKHNEGFTEDYDLPNKTAYCETCASIGMVFWNNRMNLLTGDAKYADVMERDIYNGVMSGISLEGNLFFYENPLESDGNHHRRRWFGCACCPSNLSRFLPSIGSYIYSKNDQELYVNLYLGNEAEIKIGNTNVKVKQTTDYPWDGKISMGINPEKPINFDLKMRIPGWCKSFYASVNGEAVSSVVKENGYLSIERKWKRGDNVSLFLDMPIELVAADPRVKADIGKRAVQRGPLVYCLEQVDNENIDRAVVSPAATFNVLPGEGALNSMKILKAQSDNNTLTFVPYFAWDNRSPGKMKVWIDFEEDGGKKHVLWEQGKGKYINYRIPAIVTTTKGTLLAFCEGREAGDTGDIDILLKRSSDDGKTWSEEVVVWDDEQNTCGNPCPVVDEETGRVWLWMTWNYGKDHETDIIHKRSKYARKPYLCYSDDDGLTWSEPQDMSATCRDDSWGWYATGPGFAIQMKNGKYKGRLVVPANHSYDDPDGTIRKGPYGYGAHVLISDDYGKTWRMGEQIKPGCNESQVTELSDGTLVMNMRSYNDKYCRAISYSKDGGETWSDIEHDYQLVESRCQASILYYGDYKGKPLHLFSNPAVPVGRSHMTIKVSDDDCKTWETARLINADPSAYSCLVKLPKGKIGLFYETGAKNAYETITFDIISVKELYYIEKDGKK